MLVNRFVTFANNPPLRGMQCGSFRECRSFKLVFVLLLIIVTVSTVILSLLLIIPREFRVSWSTAISLYSGSSIHLQSQDSNGRPSQSSHGAHNRAALIVRLERTRKCILGAIRKNSPIWSSLHVHINACATMHQLIELNFLRLRTDKLFLPFRKRGRHQHHTEMSCNSVTLGVGNETVMEKYLKAYYPHCRFYAADPVYEIGRPFEAYGTLYTVAIGNQTIDNKTLWIMNSTGRYGFRTVRTVSLGEFLKQQIRRPIVHFLSMDIESAEYSLLPYLSKGGSFKKDSESGITICQITIELHGPLKRYGLNNSRFEELFTNFIAESPFVPLRALIPGYHHRIYFFNTEDSQCTDLFELD